MSEVKWATREGLNLQVEPQVFNFTLINPDIFQGVDKNQRIGNTIRTKYHQLRMRVFFLPKDSTPQATAFVSRIIMGYRRNTGDDATPSTYFTNPNSAVNSPINNTSFKVIYDKSRIMTYYGNYDTSGYKHYLVIKKKWAQSRLWKYSTSNDYTVNEYDKQLVMIFVSTVQIPDDVVQNINYVYRVSFNDI